MTQILLIRHAVNDFVKTNRLAGWTPGVHLNEEGQAQAAALGERLAQTRIDAIYASPLERTVETAQAVVSHHPELTLQLLPEIGEVRYGDWTGGEIRKLAQRKMWRVIQTNPSRASFPNGEAMRDSQLRAVNAIEKLVRKHPRESVAVVSHSDIIKMILAHYLGIHLDLFQRIEISPASLSIIALGGFRPGIIQINESSYLPKPKKGTANGFNEDYEAKRPVQWMTVEAVGEPGARTFYLQAKREPGDVVSLLLEKTQAAMLADQISALFQGQSVNADGLIAPEFQTPDAPFFRAGKFGLQYDSDLDLVDLEVTEMLGVDQGTPEVLHLWVTLAQLQWLKEHAKAVVRGGLASPEN
jgi:probable phosphomutase (TIGR03848 family)/uncharacterized repeat protein (TIGR03847 family)